MWQQYLWPMDLQIAMERQSSLFRFWSGLARKCRESTEAETQGGKELSRPGHKEPLLA